MDAIRNPDSASGAVYEAPSTASGAATITQTIKESRVTDMGLLKVEGKVISSLNIQEKELAVLTDLIEQVWNMFASVLHNQENHPTVESEQVSEVNDSEVNDSDVPLVRTINSGNKTINNANDRLRTLLDLCEL